MATIRVEGRVQPASTQLRDACLFDGALVEVVRSSGSATEQSATEQAADPTPTPGRGGVFEVLAGPDAGSRIALDGPSACIGRRTGRSGHATTAELRDETVSREHLRLEVDALGGVTATDVGSTNGSWIGVRPLQGTEPVSADDWLRLGATMSRARVVDDDRPLWADPTRFASADGRVPFNRSPRPRLPETIEALEAPEPPKPAGSRASLNIVGLVAPLVLAAVLLRFSPSPLFAVFLLLGPILVLGGWVQQRRTDRVGSIRAERRFREDLLVFEHALTGAVTAEVRRRRALIVDPAETIRRATEGSSRLWERRPGHDDFLDLFVGVGTPRWTAPLTHPSPTDPRVRTVLGRHVDLVDSPVGAGLDERGIIGIVGVDRKASRAAARNLVLQVAVHHGPADVELVVLSEEADWAWTSLLPHVLHPSEQPLVAAGAAEVDATIARLEHGVATGRRRVLVVEGAALLSGATGTVRPLLRPGGDVDVSAIVIVDNADELPAATSTVIELVGDGTCTVTDRRAGTDLDGVIPALVDEAIAGETARHLARFDDIDWLRPGRGLPTVVHARDVGLEGPVRGERRDGLSAPVGLDAAGEIVHIDLVEDGPHALVAGTTGSGKSELLRTLIASLAAHHDPDVLQFLLVDYKGGSAFDACADLPHVAGLVTDLDGGLAERALRCLEAELRHREVVLRSSGATDIVEHQRMRHSESDHAERDGSGSLPRLVVVVDEFAALVSDLGDFVDRLVDVAQRGRSLGVHLVLATQRPAGVVNERIRANTDLRIALRVQSPADSVDVVGTPEAAQLSRLTPGRAVVRRGSEGAEDVQFATVSAAVPTESGVVVTDWPRVPACADDAADGRTAPLRALVDACRALDQTSSRRRRIWVPPVPPVVPLDLDGSAAGEIGVADDPDGQQHRSLSWCPDSSVLLSGGAGTGRTAGLRTLALRAAMDVSPEQLEVYVLDLGRGELAPLIDLPHVGAVIGAGEHERRHRLLRHLHAVLDDRRSLGPVDLERQTQILVMVDGFDRLVADLDVPEHLDRLTDLERLLADGRAARISLCATVSGGETTRHRHRVTFDRTFIFDGPCPGRVEDSMSGLTAQLGWTADAAASIRSVGSQWAGAEATAVAIDSFPSLVQHDELPSVSGTLVLGIDEHDLGPASISIRDDDHLFIAGPPRSGRSTLVSLLAVGVDRARRREGASLGLIVVSAGRQRLDAPADLAVDGAELSRIVDLIDRSDAARRWMLLIDDADQLDDPDGLIDALMDRRDRSINIVMAMGADAARSAFGHPSRRVRRSRAGVLLCPDVDLDGDLLGVRLPRRSPVRWLPGRGYLVHDGSTKLVQFALPGP